MLLNGRRMIKTDAVEITAENVVSVLRKALPYHWKNRSEINYLWAFYKGRQPILGREKVVRPEINNMVVENRANEIVSFKSGYLMGEPLQYVSRGNDTDADAINLLNEYVFAEEKQAKDKELADWFHICGTAYRMVLPDAVGEEDDSPFEIYTLDPRNTFVIYNNGLGEKPVLGVRYTTDENGVVTYSCYTKNEYFEIVDSKDIVKREYHVLGDIPIIEYPLNLARIGAFELVEPLLNVINAIDSNRMDGVEQTIQALLLFHNVDISKDDYAELREQGALKFRDIDPQMKAEVKYIMNALDQGQTQTLADHIYKTVLDICGMPSVADGNNSDSSNNGAVILRNGWQTAEGRAKNAELMFKKSERKFLKIILNICKTFDRMDLKVSNVEIRFTRRNYENIYQKAQVLDLMLKNPDIHPRLAFVHSGMFTDADLAYEMSKQYKEEQEKKNQELMRETYDTDIDNRDGGDDPNSSETREQSGSDDRKRQSDDR